MNIDKITARTLKEWLLVSFLDMEQTTVHAGTFILQEL